MKPKARPRSSELVMGPGVLSPLHGDPHGSQALLPPHVHSPPHHGAPGGKSISPLDIPVPPLPPLPLATYTGVAVEGKGRAQGPPLSLQRVSTPSSDVLVLEGSSATAATGFVTHQPHHRQLILSLPPPCFTNRFLLPRCKLRSPLQPRLTATWHFSQTKAVSSLIGIPGPQ